MNDNESGRRTALYGSPASEPTGSSRPEIPEYVRAEVVRSVERAVARFGVPGVVVLDGDSLILSGPSAESRVHVYPWIEHWSRMDDEARDRRSSEAARALTVAQRRPSSKVPGPKLQIDGRLALGVALLLVLVAIVYWQSAADSSAPPEDEVLRRQGQIEPDKNTTGPRLDVSRAERVCEATKARIFQGGSVSIADTDGFVVEIALLRLGDPTRIDTHPALAKFVQSPGDTAGSPFIWEGDPSLARMQTGESVVRVVRSSIGDGRGRSEAVLISFGGTLVDAYFSEAGRSRYFRVADALSSSTNATHAALYARCADDSSHVLGSWFRGLDAAGAAASLLYFMGTYATPPHLSAPFYKSPDETTMDRSLALLSIHQGTTHIDRAGLATLVGSEGGMSMGKPGDAVTISFPFQDGNRASRASRSVARVASLGR